MKCTHPDCEMYPWYGVAPHKHVGITEDPRSFIGSTRVEPKADWPAHFHEDPEAEGCGTYECPHCLALCTPTPVERKQGDVNG